MVKKHPKRKRRKLYDKIICYMIFTAGETSEIYNLGGRASEGTLNGVVYLFSSK